MSDNIKVAVRMRPRIKREEGSQDYWTCDTTKSTITDIIDASGKLGSTCFQYDHVFGPQHTNWDIYSTVVQDSVASAMEGFNGTVFAYGQTGSGKTYTISGTDNDQKRYGIIPNSVLEIFNAIENTPGREFLLRVSYMEIYNESVNDLLSSRKSLRICEDQNNQVFVEDLYEEIVSDPFDMFRLKDEGDDKRASADTSMNERSSRSHTIFRIIIESWERQEKDGEFVECSDSAVVISQLNLVDLAGFERASETNATGERLKEGCNINKSLSQLSQVISKLSGGAKEVAHVGFRNSKLTRILQNSLGGNSKTVIICNVTPAAKDQTKSTLLFAATAKTIKNCPVKNEILTEEPLLKRYKTQISVLQSEIDQLREGASVRQLETQKSDLQKQLDDKETEISRLNNLICISSRLIDSPDPSVKARAKSRRETWCPGLDRHTNIARHLLSNPQRSKKHFEAAPKFEMECIDEDEPEESAEVPPVQDVRLDVFEVACQTNEDFWEDIRNKDLREAELQQEIEDLKRQLSSPNVTKTNMSFGPPKFCIPRQTTTPAVTAVQGATKKSKTPVVCATPEAKPEHNWTRSPIDLREGTRKDYTGQAARSASARKRKALKTPREAPGPSSSGQTRSWNDSRSQKSPNATRRRNPSPPPRHIRQRSPSPVPRISPPQATRGRSPVRDENNNATQTTPKDSIPLIGKLVYGAHEGCQTTPSLERVAVADIPALANEVATRNNDQHDEPDQEEVKLFHEKRAELEEQQLHLNVGLQKIRETEEQVKEMQNSLSLKSKEFEAKNAAANAKLKQMLADQQEAEKNKIESERIKVELGQQLEYIGNKQADVKKELAEVEAAVEEAQLAVKSIKKQHLVEIRSMGNPPTPVRLALESICFLLGENATDWKAVRSVIVKDDFVLRIVSFNTDDLSPDIREKMKNKYLSNPDYNYEKMNRASQACGPMVKWCIAQLRYSDMLNSVEPLRNELKTLEKDANVKKIRADEMETMIGQLEKSISSYKEEYAVLIGQAEAIKADLTTLKGKVDRSIELGGKVGDIQEE